MFKKIIILILLVLIFIGINPISFVSMAGQERLPDENVLKYVGPKESTVLMYVKISNKYKSNYQPNIKKIIFWEYSKNPVKHSFEIKDKYQGVENSHNEYLIKIQVPGGNFKLAELTATSGFFPINGSFSIPIYTTITIPDNKIVYLGHIEANIVERTSDAQLRAGPVLPLLDQSVTGASGGTFLIEIIDNYQEDLRLFYEKYPSLKEGGIDKLILSPWKQPKKEDMEPPIFPKAPWEN